MHRIALICALAICAHATAADFTVDSALDTLDANPGDGLCADAEGACTLRAAIQETNALPGADAIAIPAGTYALALAGDDDTAAIGDLDIDDDLTITGAGSDATTIDGAALDRVFEIFATLPPRNVRFDALTIRNGALSGGGLVAGGAGVHVAENVTLQLDDVVIRDNRTTSRFGGVAIDAEGCVIGMHVRILDNVDTEQTGSGSAVAAIHAHDGANACLDLADSEISGNRADYAGAVESDFAPITLRRVLISDNEARFAGALLLNLAADTLLENVTISGNRGNPGAILNDGGSHLTIVHGTITANGPSNGSSVVGGIQDVHGGFGLTFLSNTILSGNGPGFLADDCSNATSAGGGNIVGDSAHCAFDADPSDQLDVDPTLSALADNGGFTRTQLPGAAAIDHAQAAACVATDQRGLSRPVDGDGDGDPVCDVGAVEVQVTIDAIFADGFEAG